MGIGESLKLKIRNFNSDIKFIKAEKIHGEYSNRKCFWNHHGFNKDEYMKFAGKSKILYYKWLEGKSIEEILNDKECSEVAAPYLLEPSVIKVTKDRTGFHYEGDGSHRIACAKILNLYIPVKIKKSKKSN